MNHKKIKGFVTFKCKNCNKVMMEEYTGLKENKPCSVCNCPNWKQIKMNEVKMVNKERRYLKIADKGYAIFENGYVIMRWWYFWFIVFPSIILSTILIIEVLK